MQPIELIVEYCNTVCEHIRWKKAKNLVYKEIQNHICDQRAVYIQGGDSEVLATKKAITEMGDATLIGEELNKIHKPKPQIAMIVLVGLLMSISVFANYYIASISSGLSTFGILSFLIAFCLFIGCYYIDFTILGKHPKIVYLSVLGLTIIGVLFGIKVNEIVYWNIGSFSISLSYLALVFPIAIALFIYSMKNKGALGILISIMSYIPFALILFFNSANTVLVLFTVTSFIQLCFSISRGWFSSFIKLEIHTIVFITIVTIASILIGLAIFVPSLLDQLYLSLTPQQTEGLPSLIREIIKASSFLGEGNALADNQLITFLPNINTDYTLTTLVYKFGNVFLLLIVMLFLIFLTIGIRKALREKSFLGSILPLTVILTFTFQTVCYISNNLGVIAVSQVTLPLVSYSTTALLINAILIGIMLSVFRVGETFKDGDTINKTKPDVDFIV